eukprot:c24509_g2_i2 orf=2-226(-)
MSSTQQNYKNEHNLPDICIFFRYIFKTHARTHTLSLLNQLEMQRQQKDFYQASLKFLNDQLALYDRKNKDKELLH